MATRRDTGETTDKKMLVELLWLPWRKLTAPPLWKTPLRLPFVLAPTLALLCGVLVLSPIVGIIWFLEWLFKEATDGN